MQTTDSTAPAPDLAVRAAGRRAGVHPTVWTAVATVFFLVATVLLDDVSDVASIGLGAAALVVVLVSAVLGRLRRRSSGAPLRRSARLTTELLLHLSPVILLTTVFPIASSRIAGESVGGVSLTAMLLASSLTVPWLSQAVCLPLYRGIGPLVEAGDTVALQARFMAVWPLVLLRAVPVVAVFALPVQIVMQWPLSALAVYCALCVLHLAFAQSLVLTNVGGRRRMWAVAWTAYAVALLVAPAWWFLPPLVGLLTQLVPLWRQLGEARRPHVLDRRDVAADLLRGLFVGAVLWADKLVFFLAADGEFAVQTVFIALLPAVLAYNVYFVALAPSFDRSVATLRAAMESGTLETLRASSSLLRDSVASSIARTGLFAALLGFGITALTGALAPQALHLTAAVAVASWFFMMTTVTCYKIDYIGATRPGQVIGALHLIAVVLVFALVPASAATYWVLAGIAAVLFAASLVLCLRHWREPEYTLFWRHATSW